MPAGPKQNPSRVLARNVASAELACGRLADLGVECVFASPGSRNSTLLLAAHRNTRLKTVVHFDERGMAFAGLGAAKASGKPVAILVTSGTAVANLFPALLEAEAAGLPLIFISADRPPEAHGIGANQTVDQKAIFGTHVKKFFLLKPVDEGKVANAFGRVLRVVEDAVRQTLNEPRGPVHINWMFREPLAGERSGEPVEWGKFLPLKKIAPLKAASPGPAAFRKYDTLFSKAKNPLLILGELRSLDEARSALSLASSLGWPVYADLLSGARALLSEDAFAQARLHGRAVRTHGRAAAEPRPGSEANDQAPVVKYFDRFFLDESRSADLQFDAVLHVGGRLVSKSFETHFSKWKPRTYLRVSPDGTRIDPSLAVTKNLRFEIEPFCLAWTRRREQQKSFPVENRPQTKQWLLRGDKLGQVIQNYLFQNKETEPLGEMATAVSLARSLPKNAFLFAGNSMPVRDLAAYAWDFSPGLRLAASRGLSGIDGLLGAAVGYAIGSGKPGALLVGDLSLLHDLSSLALLRESPEAFAIVVVNNGGGGIFSFLPVAVETGFESRIAHAHDLTFSGAAAQFGLAYHHTETLADFDAVLHDAFDKKQKILIEIRTDRANNLAAHRELETLIRKSLA